MLSTQLCQAQLEFEKPPIDYDAAESHDAVAELKQRISRGEWQPEYTDSHGWLPAVLEALDIRPESQVLVFSKTSLQLHKISPRTPRAIYFNDDIYGGWVQNGDVIEIAATDAQLGSVFYTIDQHDRRKLEITRDRGTCLTCHASYRTQGVPGLLVRSVFPDFSGRPKAGTRTYVTDHTSPFEQRYGGWYVTGKHGDIRHMGNVIADNRDDPEALDREAGANCIDLSQLFDVSPYLRPTSDMVAMMVLEHQTQMHNLISRLNMETRIAQAYDAGINEVLGRPKDYLSDSTRRRIASAGEKLVRYMLFADEVPLTSPIQGTSAYRELFESGKIGPLHCDSKGRSLRQFDLERRMFRYPCSYLIYSEAFKALPEPALNWVRDRLLEILTAEETPPGYEHLSAEDRSEIREILSETMPDLFGEKGERT